MQFELRHHVRLPCACPLLMNSTYQLWLVSSHRLIAMALSIFACQCFADDQRSPLSAEMLQQLRLFADVYKVVKDGYVEPLEDKKLMGACLNGMLSGIDADSAYIDSDAFSELTTPSDMGGIGLELGMEEGSIKVVAPIEGTPADGSGIRSGDLIIRIDDLPTKGMALAEAVKQLRGKPNSSVTITVVRKGETKPLAFSIKREVIKVTPVKTRLLAPGYALVRLTQFQAQSGASLAKHLHELYKENHLKGLILDLRNNPGGLFSEGIGVAAAFLPVNAVVVSTSGRTMDSKRNYLAASADYSRNGNDYLADLPSEVKQVPMVVLVNGGSAAGSEIVAGALQDHKRAIILGSQTFGRASIQTLLPLPNKTAIKLTTARWYTPDGRSVQSKGLVPDIVVSDKQPANSNAASVDDYQVARALSLLKDFRRE